MHYEHPSVPQCRARSLKLGEVSIDFSATLFGERPAYWREPQLEAFHRNDG
jgi:hypothetical protein